MRETLPVFHVKALPQKDDSKIQSALKKTCVAISEIYGCRAEQVWATWEEVKSGFYCEGNRVLDKQPNETHPPICQLICFEGKTPEQIERILSIAAITLSESMGIPNNIFITYQEVKSGQVISGNRVLKRK